MKNFVGNMFPKLFVCAMLVFAALVFFGGETQEVSKVEKVAKVDIGGTGTVTPRPSLPVNETAANAAVAIDVHQPIGGVRTPTGDVAEPNADVLPDIGGTQGVPRPFFLDETSNSQSHEYHPEGKRAYAEIL